MLDRREVHPIFGYLETNEYVSGVVNMLSLVPCKEEGWRQVWKWCGCGYDGINNTFF